MSFDPATISGLLAWWKADSIVGLADTDPVSSWSDSSGNGWTATQGTSGNRPLYQASAVSGLPAVLFDGIDDYLTTSLTAATKPLSIFTVANWANLAGNSRSIVGASANGGLEWGTDDGSSDTMYAAATFVGFIGHAATAPVISTWYRMAFTYSATSDYVFYKDGTSDGTGNVVQTFSASTIQIGSTKATIDWMSGSIGEILIYDSVLSTTGRNNVDNYLNEKWVLGLPWVPDAGQFIGTGPGPGLYGPGREDLGLDLF